MYASIATSASANHQLARNMSEHIQGKSHIHVSIVISALAHHRVARRMNEHIQE